MSPRAGRSRYLEPAPFVVGQFIAKFITELIFLNLHLTAPDLRHKPCIPQTSLQSGRDGMFIAAELNFLLFIQLLNLRHLCYSHNFPHSGNYNQYFPFITVEFLLSNVLSFNKG